MSRWKPYSSLCLAVAGIIIMGLGLYFVIVRPPLLAEDSRYMGMTVAQILNSLPGLPVWLKCSLAVSTAR